MNKKDNYIVSLIGNPNTGKSTIFNQLTGLNQKTGNWAGKTVESSKGHFFVKGEKIYVVDLPGAYSIYSKTLDEETAINFLLNEDTDATVIVLDSTCLEKSLIIALQVMTKKENVILVLNLIDEARKKGIRINIENLKKELKVPIVATNGKTGEGIEELKKYILDVCSKKIKNNKLSLFEENIIEENIIEENIIEENIIEENITEENTIEKTNKERHNIIYNEENNEETINKIIEKVNYVVKKSVKKEKLDESKDIDRKLDNIILNKYFGIPIMLLVLMFVFWLTIIGTNYPSAFLQSIFFTLTDKLNTIFINLGVNNFIRGMLVDGLVRTVGWVVSVMLPPMAIFFPIFTILEDWGFLPRIVFNLDNYFKKAKAHGKQVLTMSMGFGCNASGVRSCRIIDSKRDRILAILTNNFVPCNGRFPIIIALATIFFVTKNSIKSSILVAFIVLLAILFSVAITLLMSFIISKTLLKGMPSDFILELPPYRKPQISKVLVRSFLDRTIFILVRAVIVAAPAGIIIWIMQNIYIDDKSILLIFSNILDPFGRLLGMDGIILSAFILGLPANEIVLPIMIMLYTNVGVLTDIEEISSIGEILKNNGWTWVTAICTILFSLNHFPCGTTLLTIKKETNSLKWTFDSFLIPTIVGIILCFLVNFFIKLACL